MQQLNYCVKKRQTFLRPTCGLQTAKISVLWITRSGLSMSCSVVSTTDSVDELKRRLIDVWCVLEQSIFDETIDQWREDIERVSMLKEDTSSTACELTMLILSISVTFNATCLTVTSLITKSWKHRWPILSCSFYKVVHLQNWGMVVHFMVRFVVVNFCLQ